jgi:hypothetical protein
MAGPDQRQPVRGIIQPSMAGWTATILPVASAAIRGWHASAIVPTTYLC